MKIFTFVTIRTVLSDQNRDFWKFLKNYYFLGQQNFFYQIWPQNRNLDEKLSLVKKKLNRPGILVYELYEVKYMIKNEKNRFFAIFVIFQNFKFSEVSFGFWGSGVILFESTINFKCIRKQIESLGLSIGKILNFKKYHKVVCLRG